MIKSQSDAEVRERASLIINSEPNVRTRPIPTIIQNQGEYLRFQPQDESDNSESIYAPIATLRLDNP